MVDCVATVTAGGVKATDDRRTIMCGKFIRKVRDAQGNCKNVLLEGKLSMSV